MQAVIGEYNVANRISGTYYAVPPHPCIDRPRNTLSRKDRKEKGSSVAGRVYQTSESQSRHPFESFANAKLALTHARNDRRKFAQLYTQNSCAKFIEAVSASPSERSSIMKINFAIAVSGITHVLQSDSPAPESVTVCHDGSALTRAHVLVDLKAKYRNIAEGTHTSTLDPSADALSTIFNDADSVLPCDFHTRQNIARGAIHMGKKDDRSAGGNSALYILRIEGKGFVDVGENRHCAQIDDRGGDRNPEVRWDNDFLARSHPQCSQRRVQSCRTAGDGNGVAHSNEGRKFGLELGDFPLRINPVITIKALAAKYAKQGFLFITIKGVGTRKFCRQGLLTNGYRGDGAKFMNFVSSYHHLSNLNEPICGQLHMRAAFAKYETPVS